MNNQWGELSQVLQSCEPRGLGGDLELLSPEAAVSSNLLSHPIPQSPSASLRAVAPAVIFFFFELFFLLYSGATLKQSKPLETHPTPPLSWLLLG